MAKKPSLLGYTPPGAGSGAFLGRKFDQPQKQSLFPELLTQNYDPQEWAKRPDGSDKGQGFLGILQRPDGGVSTEISASFGDKIAGGQDIPLLVPTLTKNEVQSLLSNNAEGSDFFQSVPPSVFEKAIDFARHRQSLGLPYFAQPYEYVPQKYSGAPIKK